ncbi:ABC transporter permease [Aeromonas veronii]|uniref:ABC transporter permease n=1 Tax=Aeromonas veronii TaxID=654 RepID=UPI003550B3E6
MNYNDSASSSIRNKIANGFLDIIDGANKLSMAIYFAWGDTRARYRRSLLGPFWMVLTSAISVAGLGFLWSLIFKEPPEKIVPSLTIGLVVWQFLSSCIIESPSIFYRNAHFIRNIKTPYFVFILHVLLRQVINLAHNFIVIVVVLIYFSIPLNENQLLIVPGFALVILNLCWVTLLMALIGARFRDFEQIVVAFMPLFFFMSPVIFRPSQLSMAQEILWLNPFSYLITLIRDPIVGQVPPMFVYLTSIIVFIVGSLFTLYQFGKYKKNISFWI